MEKTKAQDRSFRAELTLNKEGVFTGAYAVNPLTRQRVPIFVGNFVLMEYGTGAIMAVPAHDQRDFEFAREFSLPVIVTIMPIGTSLDPASMEGAYEGDGVMVNSGPFDGTNNKDAIPAIIDYLEERRLGRRTINFRLKDWGISRQRYWGTPYSDDLLRRVRRRARTLRRPARGAAPRCQSRDGGKIAARRQSCLLQRRMPQVWKGCEAGDRHHGHLRRVVVVFPQICIAPLTEGSPSTGSRSITGRLWTSTSAAWSTPSSISSTRGSSTGSSTSLD